MAGRVAAAVAAVAVVTGLLAFVSWRDGSPGPWLWISMAAAPLGVVLGGVAWAVERHSDIARASTLVSAFVTAFWVAAAAWLLSGLQ